MPPPKTSKKEALPPENDRMIALRLPLSLLAEIDKLRTVKKRNGLFAIALPRSAFLREVIALGLEAVKEGR